jgi:F-type H+-transporting ATPase subunit a
MAIFVMILVWITGIRVKGKRYFKHFVEPYPALLPLNLVEELTKPITLSLRLFGNILAGTVMVSVLALMPAFLLWLPTAAWKLFDMFIGILQALIFALLTILYFGFAAAPEEEETH